MRRDLLTWLLLGDIAAIITPALLRAAVNPVGALMTAGAGFTMMVLAWTLGAMRVDVIDQARSGWGHQVKVSSCPVQ